VPSFGCASGTEIGSVEWLGCICFADRAFCAPEASESSIGNAPADGLTTIDACTGCAGAGGGGGGTDINACSCACCVIRDSSRYSARGERAEGRDVDLLPRAERRVVISDVRAETRVST
jgi:hypothetical protein